MAKEQTMRMLLETLTKEELIDELILLKQCSETTSSSGGSDGVEPPAKRLRIGKEEKRKGQQRQQQQQRKGKKTKKSNPFSIHDYALRHVALRIAYIGTKYGGFASQRHTTETVEAKIFQALREARLIDTGSDDGEGGKEREPITSASDLAQRCSYTRCGRTDKGVSAFGQVISLHIRSNLITKDLGIVSLPLIDEGSEEVKNKRKGAGGKQPGGQQPGGEDGRKQQQSGKERVEQRQREGRGGGMRKELNYPSILNSLLPDDIRVVGWAPVSLNFNSRFSCLYRTYKYYFFNSIGGTGTGTGELNIERMRQGAKLFLGEHDFRNLCKIDAVNVFNFKRVVLSIDISPFSSFSSSTCFSSSASASSTSSGSLPPPSSSSSSSSTSQSQVEVYEITICGYAFLWHQIRCMMAILFMIGNGSESPEVSDQRGMKEEENDKENHLWKAVRER
jgi:tRNA pseudouridine38/39 synthase